MSRTARARLWLDQRDLMVVIVLAVSVPVAVVLDVSPLFRTLLGIPLVLLLPGYAYVCAVFPSFDLPAVERLLISVGGSIALAILAGLLLAWTGIGLTPLTWSLALSALTVIGCAAAWMRRVERGTVGPSFSFVTMPRMGALMVILALLIVANVLAGSRLIAGAQQSPAPAALWMFRVDEPPADARLGVRADGDGGEYTVRLSSSGAVLEEYPLELESGEVWETLVDLPDDVADRPVVARLYEGDSDAEIRFVILQPATDGG
ncbi:MAG TPA: DUF1616 domain-containing protein [Candidatus Limnocylindrales bacterium]|nr:DUF1616 domain-containing protein [Candidatus Limnocylindrales bacterium]